MTRPYLIPIIILVLLGSFGARRWIDSHRAAPFPGGTIRSGDTPPELLFRVEPEYSEESRRARINASVQIEGVVDRAGRLQRIRVLRGAGFGLDERAVEAVRRWQFKPGVKSRSRAEVKAMFTVPFRAFPHGATAHLQFRLADGTTAPVLLASTVTPIESFGQIRKYHLEVDAEGRTESVDGPSDGLRDRIAMWRFIPSMRGGSPVRAIGELVVYAAN